MRPPSAVPYLTGIIKATGHIREKSGATPLEAFKQDWEQQWIVQRGVEIISGGSRYLPELMKARHPALPWRRIAEVGNRQMSPPPLWVALARGRFREGILYEVPPAQPVNGSGGDVQVDDEH
jgi:hypothetical protein